VLKAYSFSLAESDSSEKALEAACDAHGGRSPDAVFLCAGKATPGYFVEETARSLQDGMANAYWTQAWSAFVSCCHIGPVVSAHNDLKAAARRMAKDGTHGKIVFVASVLGYMSIVGYSTYSPAKFALRGMCRDRG
jgi:3-dehydrosphinganine reductase